VLGRRRDGCGSLVRDHIEKEIIAPLPTCHRLEHLWVGDWANWYDQTDCSAGSLIGYSCLHGGITPKQSNSHLSIEEDLAFVVEIDAKMRAVRVTGSQVTSQREFEISGEGG
jgi:hypothetical protein